MIRVEELLAARFPVWNRMPQMLRAATVAVVRGVTRFDDVQALVASHGDARGAAFIDRFFEDLDVSRLVSTGDAARIPAHGRLVVVANHPLGAMDALALLRTLLDVRSDVRVVTHEFMLNVDSLAANFLPFDQFSARPRKSHLAAMGKTLEQEAALMIFPSGDVSRLTTSGFRDRAWLRGAAHLAHKYDAPILPVFIGGRNSWLFYAVSLFSRTAANFLLPRQIFSQRGKTIALTIGDPIPGRVFGHPYAVDALRTHVYQMNRHAANVPAAGV